MSKGKGSLNELMGKKGEDFAQHGIEFDDLPQLFGEKMPKLEFHALGRVRLMRALKQRFGEGFRSVPGVEQLMKKFDGEAQAELDHIKLKKRLGRK